MSIRHLEQLLSPRSIAVIGASNRTGSVGTTVWRNLRAGRFAGPIFPVNPKFATLDGVQAFADVGALPEAPDLAVVCTPPATVPGLIAELGRRGTAAAVVITAGLDAAQKQAMLDAAKPHLLRILGPNCIGMLSPHAGVNASFAHTDALPGEVAFISQSGALVTAVLDWATSRGLGFSHLISLGERADVDFGDLLDYLGSDARTRSILLYIESGEAPRKFMSAARAAARNKPVIVVKAGRAGNGVKAAASHTGALAGSDVVFDAAIRRAGMLRVDSLQELFLAAETLARFRDPGELGLTMMTNGGGAGVMAADAAALVDVPLRDLEPDLVAKLDEVLPANWSRANPIDIIGDAPASRYTDTLQYLLAHAGTGAVLFMHAPTAIVRSADIARACAPIVRSAAGRVMASWLGDAAVAEARRVFSECGVANYETPEEAVRAFSMLRTYRRNQALLLEAPTATEHSVPDLQAARHVIDGALANGRTMLDEHEAKSVLAAYGIPTVPTRIADPTVDAAVQAARELGYPVVLKILSPQISHKSDVGGVALSLRDGDEVANAVTQMLSAVQAKRPDAHVTGFTVQPMVTRSKAQELIVGASLDPLFGPVILFGQGGVAVEVVADRAIALAPLNRVLARDLMSRTRVSRLLAGFRDRPPADESAICDVLIAVSQMLVDLPQIAELDINPLLADADGVVALDARIRVRLDPGDALDRFAILPYPQDLCERVPWQGHEIELRPIRPEDESRHRHFVDQLTPEDLRLRFFNTRRSMSRSELARLVQIDYAREMAFVAVRPSAQGEETLGVIRAVRDPDNVEAEFAVIVRSDLKHQGLGQLLLDKMVAYLRQQGTRRVVGVVLRENSAMRQFMRRSGFLVEDRASNLRDDDSQRHVLRLEA